MAKPVSVEDHLRQIEEAVEALEAGDLPLEQALIRYESGLKALRAAKVQLDAYAAKLEELKADPAPTAGG